MATYRITHITRYSYITPVIDSANQLLLYPISDDKQEVKKHKLEITGNPSVEVYEDFFGNTTGFFTVISPHTELKIISEIEVITQSTHLPSDHQPSSEQWDLLNTMHEQMPFIDFLSRESFESAALAEDVVKAIVSSEKTPLAVGKELSTFVYDQFTYQKGITTVLTKLDEVWSLKAGVCQDFAHVLLVLLRMAGIPARYISGYICPKNHDLRGEGATHAWVEAYIPNFGWIGLDPTNNCIVNDRHIRLAVGRDFSDCTPVKGTYKGASQHTLEVSVTIENGALPTFIEPVQETSYQYSSRTSATPVNSYQLFLEMQQQQQQ